MLHSHTAIFIQREKYHFILSFSLYWAIRLRDHSIHRNRPILWNCHTVFYKVDLPYFIHSFFHRCFIFPTVLEWIYNQMQVFHWNTILEIMSLGRRTCVTFNGRWQDPATGPPVSAFTHRMWILLSLTPPSFDSIILFTFAWEGNGNPLQYSCLENPMDTVHRVAKSWTRLSDFTFTMAIMIIIIITIINKLLLTYFGLEREK